MTSSLGLAILASLLDIQSQPAAGRPAPLPPPYRMYPVHDYELSPRNVSITLTPFQLLSPIHRISHNAFRVLELTGEVRAHDKVGIALLVAAGSGKDPSHGTTLPPSSSAFKMGGQVRYYFSGDFRRGAHVGIELYYFRIWPVLRYATYDVRYDFEGYAAGPFLGYKYGRYYGFTVDAQLGLAGVNWTKKDADHYSPIYPLISLKIGWSV